MLRVQHAHFAAFIHVEGDLAEVHEVELLVQGDVVAADGGNGAALGLRGSKSVEARTISSPTFQPFASSTWIEVAPALAVTDSLLQLLVVEPCRFRVPPESMIPRSPMPPMTSSPFTWSVRVMVALRV